MTPGIVTAAYIISSVLFILALGGLSNPESARRGNMYGILGMALAVIVTVLGIGTANYVLLFGTLVVGSAVGLLVAQRVKMTQMPELVAILHSLVGLGAVIVGYATFLDPHSGLTGVERTIHDVEIYLGILIGAVTFSGSVIAFGKLSGKIGGKPMILPARCESPGLNGRNRTRDWSGMRTMLVRLRLIALFEGITVLLRSIVLN